MLSLAANDLRLPDEIKNYLLFVKEKIPSAHEEIINEIGVEGKYRRLWKKLIDTRSKEYSQGKKLAREVVIEYENKHKPLVISDLERINLILPPLTVAVGAFKHMARKKTKGKEKLFKLITKGLSRF